MRFHTVSFLGLEIDELKLTLKMTSISALLFGLIYAAFCAVNTSDVKMFFSFLKSSKEEVKFVSVTRKDTQRNLQTCIILHRPWGHRSRWRKKKE